MNRTFDHVILSGAILPASPPMQGELRSRRIAEDLTRSFDYVRLRFAAPNSAQDDSLTTFVKGVRQGLLFVLFAMVFASCSSPSDPPATTSTGEELTGTVAAYASASATSLSPSGIHISIQSTAYQAVADTAGHFEIDNIPAGVYNIIFWKPGYDSMIYPVHHILGVGTDVINDAYLVQESSDTITMTGVSYVFNVSETKIITVTDTTIKDSLGKFDTIASPPHDSEVVIYDTAGNSNGMILSGKVTGSFAPGNIYVYTSLDSNLFPTMPSPQLPANTEDAWLATQLNSTAYHAAFQSPQMIGGNFKDTLTADVATLLPYSLPAGQAVYVYVVGHSNMSGVPAEGGEYQHFNTTPYGPVAVRFKYVVP
jgi:Polysaccharide lyase family 4, domain II